MSPMNWVTLSIITLAVIKICSILMPSNSHKSQELSKKLMLSIKWAW